MTRNKISKVNKKTAGTAERPRASVFRSNRCISVQLVDDSCGKTLLAASTKGIKDKQTATEKARILGGEVAKKASEKKIKAIVYDRNGYQYHGQVRALAEGMREGGINF
ncbi:MAG: 50S ribosomal protein L18 [Patescibacteria group bacterium]|jgi:large subunit ribosomal protein L18